MTEHYFSEKQTSKLIKREWAIDVGEKRLYFETASGTFSPRQLDKGTQALIDHMQLPPTGRLLDLGCGNGIIGIIAAAESPALEVILSDINSRAIAETKANIKRNGLVNAKAVKSDIFENIEGDFDCIVSNPPFSAGRSIVFAMITESFNRLKLQGSLQMVCPKNKGGDALATEMERAFGNVETIGKKSGFHVYKSVKT